MRSSDLTLDEIQAIDVLWRSIFLLDPSGVAEQLPFPAPMAPMAHRDADVPACRLPLHVLVEAIDDATRAAAMDVIDRLRVEAVAQRGMAG